MQGSFMSIAAGVCPPFEPASLPLAVPAPNRFSTLKKGQGAESSDVIFSDIPVSRSLKNSIVQKKENKGERCLQDVI